MEGNHRYLYKLEVLFLKLIPFVLSSFYFIHTVLYLLEVSCPWMLYLSGIGLLPILFIFISSFVFKFCIYHRIPLYYVITNNIVNAILPSFELITGFEVIVLHSLMFGAFSIVCGILKILNK